MPDLPELKKIALNNIIHADDWNLHPFLPPDPPAGLCSSISKLGILHPPIVKKQTGDTYLLLCGRYRLQALQRSGLANEGTACLILDKDTGPGEILPYVLEDQLLTGHLSPMEEAYCFSYWFQRCASETHDHGFPAIPGKKMQEHVVRQKMSLLELENEIQYSVHSEAISEKMALELLQLDLGDRLAMHRLFQNLSLGRGKQKRLLTLCRDLALRKEIPIAGLLQEPECVALLDHTEMNPPQIAGSLLSLFHRKLMPESSAAEEEFTRRIARMKLPDGCTVAHSPSFEQDEISVTLQFRDLSEIERRQEDIRKIIGPQVGS